MIEYIKNNYEILDIHEEEKNRIILKLSDYNIEKNIMGIYLFDNNTKKQNCVVDGSNLDKIYFDMELLNKFLKYDDLFCLKSKIKLEDEVYYLPIVCKNRFMFPINYKINNQIITFDIDKSNYIYISKKKLEELNIIPNKIYKFKLVSMENKGKISEIELTYNKSIFNSKINSIKIKNRLNLHEEIDLEFEQNGNKVNIYIENNKVLNKSIFDFIIYYEYENKIYNSRISIDDNNFVEKYVFNKNEENIFIKLYKTRDENLSIILNNDENKDMLITGSKVLNLSENKISKGLVLRNIYTYKNKLRLDFEENKTLKNKTLSLKDRRNYIKYKIKMIKNKDNIMTFEIDLKDEFHIINGIYDIKIDSSNLSIVNKDIIINPIVLIDNKGYVLRIRPYITLDGNIAFLVRNNNNILNYIEKIDKYKNQIRIIGSIKIPHNNYIKLNLKNMYIRDENDFKIYFKTKFTTTKDNKLLYTLYINLNDLKEIKNNRYHIFYDLKLKKSEIRGINIVKDINVDFRNTLLYSSKNELYNDEEIIIGIDNNNRLYLDKKNENEVFLVNLSKQINKYKLKLNIDFVNKSSYENLKELNIVLSNKKINIPLKEIEIKEVEGNIEGKFQLTISKDYIIKNLLDIKNQNVYCEFNYSDRISNIYINCIDEDLIRLKSTFKSNAMNLKKSYISIFIDAKTKKINIENRIKKEYESLRKLISYILINIIAFIIKPFIRKDIWLIGENLGEIAQDNGFAFFKYCISENINEKVFYVATKDNKNMQDLKKYNKNILIYNTFKHKLYYILSKYLIVAHGIRDVIPEIQHNKMKYNNKDIIYLQHGIIAMKKVFFNKNSYNGKIKKFVVSSEQEKNILVKEMKMREEQILVSGLARFDYLEDKSKNLSKKKITIMPTWREWLLNSEDEIKNSKFYKSYYELLSDKRLKEILKKYDVELNFILHLNMEKYKNLFSFISENEFINIKNLKDDKISDLIKESSLWITDYSSVILDFNYLKKPCLFFQPDRNEYLKNRGSFVDFDDMLVGKSCSGVDELIISIEECINNEFEYPDKYEKLYNQYYKYKDKLNSKRIYEAIKELDKKR